MSTKGELAGMPALTLNGVDHTARPTWKLRETVEFYRDKLGLPLVHAITAQGLGPSQGAACGLHPFLFRSREGRHHRFFYYIGTEQPPELVVPRGYMAMANHTAWRVETEEDLLAWQSRLEVAGVQVSQFIKHEILESIYFRDPNFYPLEITRPLRAVQHLDNVDAELTITAALELADAGGWTNIEQLWRLKAKHVAPSSATRRSLLSGFFVLDVPDLLRRDCRKGIERCRVYPARTRLYFRAVRRRSRDRVAPRQAWVRRCGLAA